MSDFTSLLLEAEKLSNEIEGTNELPKVDRSLRQVLEASNELYSRVAQSGSKDIQANLLLGSKGIDLPKISQKLDSISSKRTFESVDIADDIDLDSFLKKEMHNCLLGLIEDEHETCFARVQEELWQHQQSEWQMEKRKLLHAMTAPSGSFADVTKHKCISLEPSPIGSSLLDKQEALYAMKVMQYNLSQYRGVQKQNLVHTFASAAEEYKDSKIIEMWEIMKYMTDLPPFPQTDDTIKVRYSKPTIKALVNQGKKYLEDRYKTYMTNVINENLVLAQRGGVPGTYPLVKSFVGIRLHGEYFGLENGHIDERPLWPMVYYCIRAGDVAAALYCLKKANTEFTELQQILETKLNNPDHFEIGRLESSVRLTYKRCVRNVTDPFKRIVWAVLGCCDITDEHSEVAKTVDDYLWLKLSLVRTDYDKDDHIKYNDLQKTVLEEYGENHYDAINQPHLYFQVLALTGQFEVAIEFLVRIQRYRLQGVHIGIALHELYMLGRPSDYSCPLIFIDPADPRPSRRMNIARLIMLYVRKFEVSSIEEAIHYFYLLNGLHNKDGTNVYSRCVSDLAQETKEYERLFGRIQRNGVRTKGLLDQFKNPNVSVEKLATQVADELKEKALFEDAVDLYDLSNRKADVIALLCILLSQVVQFPSQDGSLRDRLSLKVRVIAERYEREGYNGCNPNEVSSFKSLMDLLTFFNYYHAKQYKEALMLLRNMQIIPLHQTEIDERIQTFKRLNGDVAKVLPDVLLATMNMLFSNYQSSKDTEYMPKMYNQNVDAQLVSLREQANAVTTYAGMLPYRMPGDTNSRLVQMEILMH